MPIRSRSASIALVVALASCPKPEPPAPEPPASPPPIPVATAPSAARLDESAVDGDDLLVRFSATQAIPIVEVVCPSGFRERAPTGQDEAGARLGARLDGVPAEACTVYFKGAVPARFGPAKGGQSLECDFIETTAVCREATVATAGPAAKRRPERDQVIVYVEGTAGTTAVDVVCPGGWRRWAAVTGGLAVVDGVPRSEECVLDFEGRATAQYRPVHGGMTLSCASGNAGMACSRESFGPEPRAATAASSPVPPGMVEVQVEGDGIRAVELNCPGGYRARASFTRGKARITGVPREQCSLVFKGTVPARFQPVTGGQRLACGIIGSTAVCQEAGE